MQISESILNRIQKMMDKRAKKLEYLASIYFGKEIAIMYVPKENINKTKQVQKEKEETDSEATEGTCND